MLNTSIQIERSRRDHSIRQTALYTGVSRYRIGKYESSSTSLTAGGLEKLLHYFELKVYTKDDQEIAVYPPKDFRTRLRGLLDSKQISMRRAAILTQTGFESMRLYLHGHNRLSANGLESLLELLDLRVRPKSGRSPY